MQGWESAGHLGDLDALVRMGMDADRLTGILTENEEELQSLIAAMS